MQRVVRAVGVDGPLTASLCQNEVVADLKHRRPSVDHIIRIGMDTSVRRETGKE
jgi:transposase